MEVDDWGDAAFKMKKRRLATKQPNDEDLHQSAQVRVVNPSSIPKAFLTAARRQGIKRLHGVVNQGSGLLGGDSR